MTRNKRGRLLLAALLVFLGTPLIAAKQTHWFGDPQMNRLYVLLSTFFREGVFAPEKATMAQLVSLYIKQYDSYAAIYSPEEYQAFQRSLLPIFGGVQMDIQGPVAGKILCHPVLDGEAFAAGIKDGDQLIAINGEPCSHLEIHLLAMKIRGEPGTQVTLTVQTEGEAPREVTISRTLSKARSVWKEQVGRHEVCTIGRFNPETVRELRSCVNELQSDDSLILDLRGNVGGDLDAAIQAAAMFLPKESEIVTLVSTTTSIVHQSQTEQFFTMPAIILLQDATTASAAEVFIAALVQNKRAISLGTQSFGKGAAQKFVELHDGSAILLSYARLLPPGKKNYHGTGLPPTIAVATSLIQEDAAALSARLDAILDSPSPIGSPSSPTDNQGENVWKQ